jgi:hypothetical protein
VNTKPIGPGWTHSRAHQQAVHSKRWVHRARRLHVDVDLPNQSPRLWRVHVFSWGNLLAQDDVDFVQQALGCQGSDLIWPAPDQCSFTVPYEEPA